MKFHNIAIVDGEIKIGLFFMVVTKKNKLMRLLKNNDIDFKYFFSILFYIVQDYFNFLKVNSHYRDFSIRI